MKIPILQRRAPITYIFPRQVHLLAGTAALFAATFLAARGQNPTEQGFPAGIRLEAKARGEAAIAALGARLPEVAAFYGKSPQQLRDTFRGDRSLWINPEGELFYVCPPAAAEIAEGTIAQSIGPIDPSPFDTSQAFLLHSRPGAKRVIYLDFDGHADASGKWKAGAVSPPFDLDGNEANFSVTERNRIIGVWQRVAEDYSMYEIDVTTQDPGIEALRKTSSSDPAYGVRVVIGGSSDTWYGSSSGGVAFVGSFDNNTDTPCWVFPKQPGCGIAEKNIAESASHEAGHTLGLNHDGVEGGASYYSGQGNWAPIMGVAYNREISQWSKGEYNNANNPQDDLAVMLTQGAVYRPDDHGGTVATATNLTTDASSVSVNGVIERSTDLDFFRVTAAAGSLVIKAKPAPIGPDLRIEVKLYNGAGVLLQTATSVDTAAGTQPVTLTRTVTAGTYYFSVDGVGNGDPLTTGYSGYASIGQYSATVTGVVPSGFTWLAATAGIKQWNTPSNWAPAAVPNAAGITVRVNNDITGDQTIQLASTITLGSLFLGDSDSSNRFTLASSGGSLVFNNSGNSANLSKTTGGDDVISTPVSLVGELVLTQSSSGTLGLSGGISGSGGLTKSGAGTAILTTPNSYTGATTLEDGLVRLDNAGGLPGGIDAVVSPGESALVFKGGVLGLATGDFTRPLGAGAGKLDWTNGSGGFAAFGADREVRLNNGTASVSWATEIVGTNNTLILGDSSATHTIDFKNGISFAGDKRTIQVEDGEAAEDAVLSGVLSDSNTASGLRKTGNGVLSLTNANTYGGSTTVADGVLRLQNPDALPSGNVELTGGSVLGLGAGNLVLTRSLGIGADQIRWTGSGGFAAFGANRQVRFTDSSLNWTATNFIGGGRALILGHETSDATLIWQQRISLAGSPRVIQVDDGSADIDAKMSGPIAGGSSGTNNSLTKAGVGTLSLIVQPTYYGDTTVNAGTLMIGDGGAGGGVSQNSPNIIVESGATLAVNRNNSITQGTNPLMVPVSGEGGLSQIGTGNTVLTLANTYSGPTNITAGTLSLGSNDVIPDGSAIALGNATFDAATFQDTLSTLDVEGNATINLGSGALLAFANSSAIDWSGGTLNLTGTFVSASSLRFGTNSGGLTAAQLALFHIAGYSSFSLNPNGFLIGQPLQGYAAWQAANQSTGTPADDDDGDGVANALEYILGGTRGANDLAKLPMASTLAGDLIFTFVRDQASIDGSTIVEIQLSSDLTTWPTTYQVPDGSVAASPGLTVAKETPAAGSDRVTLTLPQAPDAKIFIRLKVNP